MSIDDNFQSLVECVQSLASIRKVSTSTIESLFSGAYDSVICDMEWLKGEIKLIIERCNYLNKGGD